MTRWGIICLVLATIAIRAERAEAGKIYWTTVFSQSVERANLDGTAHEIIVPHSNVTSNICLDTHAQKVYWSGSQGRGISRAHFDGSDRELLVQPVGEPSGIALNTGAGTMYWAEGSTTRKIMRSNLDGTGIQSFLTLPSGYADDLAFDVFHLQLYWTNPPVGAIYRSELDGTGVTEVVKTGVSPIGLALDLVGGKMYWTENGTDGLIRRANLDGTGIEDLVTSGLGNPLGIALDVAAGKMYWADHHYRKIQRANLDGTGIEDVIQNTSAAFIALDVPVPEPTTLALLALGGLLATCTRGRREDPV